MAIHLLECLTGKRQSIESFTYVLAWVAARHAPNAMDVTKRGEFLCVFDATTQDSERKVRLLSNNP